MAASRASLIRHRSPLAVNPATGELFVSGAPKIPVRIVAATSSLGLMFLAAIALLIVTRN